MKKVEHDHNNNLLTLYSTLFTTLITEFKFCLFTFRHYRTFTLLQYLSYYDYQLPFYIKHHIFFNINIDL